MPGAAFSVPANIAEGSSKESNREFARFLQIAAGPAAELHYHVRFATDAALIPRSAGDALLAETARVRKMLVCPCSGASARRCRTLTARQPPKT
jgi:four helix bundle protein